MSCGLEFFSTEVSAAPPKVIAHVPPNELIMGHWLSGTYMKKIIVISRSGRYDYFSILNVMRNRANN
jgi:hypothetical protein